MDEDRRERDLRLLWRTTVLLLRDASRCESMARVTEGTLLAREFAEEAAVARRLEREVRRLANRLENEVG